MSFRITWNFREFSEELSVLQGENFSLKTADLWRCYGTTIRFCAPTLYCCWVMAIMEKMLWQNKFLCCNTLLLLSDDNYRKDGMAEYVSVLQHFTAAEWWQLWRRCYGRISLCAATLYCCWVMAIVKMLWQNKFLCCNTLLLLSNGNYGEDVMAE